jgi:hypothetical protein
VFSSDVFRRFHEALSSRLLQHGQLLLARLQVEGRPLALVYGFISGKTCHYYQGGVDTEAYAALSPGLLMHLKVADALGDTGVERYDLMLSAAPDYKARIGRETCQLYNFSLRQVACSPGQGARTHDEARVCGTGSGLTVAEALRKILRVIDPSDHLKAVLLVCVMLLAAITQATGIVSIVPFLAVLSEPQMVESNALLKQLYEALAFENRDDFLFFLGVVAFTVFASGTALQAVNFWLTTRFANGQQYKLSRRLMSDYLRRPYAFFLTRNSSDLAKTVLQETMSAVSGVLLPAMNLLSQVFVALMLTTVLVLANPVLAVSVALTIGGIYGLIFYLSRRWLTSIGEDTVRANAERFRAASDCFAGAKEIRLLGRERAYLEQYRVPSQRWAGMQANSKLIANTPCMRWRPSPSVA